MVPWGESPSTKMLEVGSHSLGGQGTMKGPA